MGVRIDSHSAEWLIVIGMSLATIVCLALFLVWLKWSSKWKEQAKAPARKASKTAVRRKQQ